MQKTPKFNYGIANLVSPDISISIRFPQREIKSASRTLELRVFFSTDKTSVSFMEMLNGHYIMPSALGILLSS
jgi:hypothetical protein